MPMIKNILATIVLVWALVWCVLSAVDSSFCRSKGLDYSHTTPALVGYCRAGEHTIRAELIGY